MPSQPTEPYTNIFSVLSNLPIFYQKGKLKKERDNVWNDALIHLQKIKKHNLYLYVQQDRKKIQTNLRRKHNTVFSIEKISIIDEESNEVKDYFEILNNQHSLKYGVSLNAVIRTICARPFSVLYCLPEQLDLWNDLKESVNSPVFLMTTDGLVKNVVTRKSTSKNVLWYTFVIKVDDNILPLYQVISEEKTSQFFRFFFREYLRDDFKAPSELIVGYPYSLLESVSNVFNGCSLEKYNLICYNYLMTSDTLLPHILIRVDIMELLKVIDKWDCIKNPWTKKFYMYSIIYLSTLKSLDIFKETVLDILVLCQSSSENKITELSQEKLLLKLRINDVKKYYETYLEYVSNKNTYETFSCTLLHNDLLNEKSENAIFTFITNLKLKVSKMCSTYKENKAEINSYYCPDLMPKLMGLLHYFPLWTKMIELSTDNLSSSEKSNILSYSSYSSYLETSFPEPLTASDFIKYYWKLIQSSCQQQSTIV